MWGLPLAVAGVKRGPGDDVIVVGSEAPEQLLEDYRVRWATETLFACLKTRGFRREDTPLTDPQRLSKLLAVLALTLAWAHRTGEWLCQHQPIRLKKHSGGRRRAASATALTPCGG